MSIHHTPIRVFGMTVFLMVLVAATLVGARKGLIDLSLAAHTRLAAASGSFSLLDSTNVVKLDVPYFHQQYPNSCEASSLRMALAYYGIETDDMGVLEKIGYRPRLKDQEKNEWDDPQEQFVGFVDVSGNTNGYGVYGLPVANAAKEFGRKAEYRTVITPQFLAKEISNKHPIIIWGSTTVTAPPYTWNLADGGTVKALKGEHARVIVGYRGPALDPSGFYVHDPINGKSYQYWTTTDLLDNLYGVTGVTNQAVVVR
jgi:uncharacterized protein YvpB